MNATQTAIVEFLTASNSYHTVAEIVKAVGKGETTVRKAIKDLLEDATLSVDVIDGVKHYTNTPEVSDDEPTAEDKPKKRYQRHQTPTTRTTRTNQITKCEVRVTRTDEDEALAKEHGVGTKWMTVCETHGDVVGTDLVLDAHWFSSYPLFCKATRKLVQANLERRRAVKGVKVPAQATRWLPKSK